MSENIVKILSSSGGGVVENSEHENGTIHVRVGNRVRNTESRLRGFYPKNQPQATLTDNTPITFAPGTQQNPAKPLE